ncbi:MAG: hypothetical protein R3E89_15615 [Thiolinea sp.]
MNQQHNLIDLQDKADHAYLKAVSMTSSMILSADDQQGGGIWTLKPELQGAYILAIEDQIGILKSAFDALAKQAKAGEVQP